MTTTPRDAIAGLSERLRDDFLRGEITVWNILPDAATQLDALCARVKELVAERDGFSIKQDGDGCYLICEGHHHVDEPCEFERFVPEGRCGDEASDNARLQQERDTLEAERVSEWNRRREADSSRDAALAAADTLRTERGTLARVMEDTANELGCASDNEAILEAIARLRKERDALEETADRHLQTLNDNDIGSHTEAVVLVVDLRRQLKLAQQERDEAYERAAAVADAVRAPASIGRDKGRHHEAGAQHAATAIRRLASGPDKEKR